MTTINNTCEKCGGTDMIYCESRGDTYCTNCGYVLEENHIVDSITFTENASGSVKAIGQFIPSTGFTLTYNSREIRELTLQRGYNNIQQIADRLQLPMNLVEAAQRIYVIGVQRGFTIGRISQHVAAACLYISCRRDKAPQLLVDFSDVLLTPAKILGRMFVKMLRVLRIYVPTIDPSLFMERFAAQMKLENKTHEVAQTGVRLVQAMTRDWISTGRRPTGLCGAALLISARYHGIKVNAEDISSIIRMASSTISKRLSEFKKTATAKLKQSEFEKTDLLSLPVISEPPCLKASRLKTPELKDGSELVLALPSYAPLRLSPVKTLSRVSLDVSSEEICNQVICVVHVKHIHQNPTGTALTGLAHHMLNAIEEQFEPIEKEIPAVDPTVHEDPLKNLLTSVKQKIPQLSESLVPCGKKSKETPLFFTEPNTAELELCRPPAEVDSETLSDVSDGEVNRLILNDQERQAKSLIWDELMKQIMPELCRRNNERKRREIDGVPKKTRKRHHSILHEPAATVADSILTALQSKNPSIINRVDDDALKSLFGNFNNTLPPDLLSI